MELEIEIDEQGNVLLSRDHEIMVELVKLLNPDDKEFENFFNSKPKNNKGQKNYKIFCG